MSDVAASASARHRPRGADRSRWSRLRSALRDRRLGRARPPRVVSVLLGAEELVVVEGRLTAAAAPRVQAALQVAAARAHVVVDLRRVRSIDHAAADTVIAAARSADHPAIVVAPAHRRARHRLERAASAASVELRHEPVAG